MAARKINPSKGCALENGQQWCEHDLYLYIEFVVNGIKHAKHAKVWFYKQGGSKQLTETGVI